MEKKEALEILEGSKPSCAIRETITGFIGDDKGNAVWNRAAELVVEFTNKYPSFPKSEYFHVKGIFNASALYLSLKELSGDNALEIMEKGMAVYAREAAKAYQKMVKMPFGRTFFLKGFAMGAKKMFGETAGFKREFHCANSKKLRFDVLECPYVKYTTELGCPEIAHIFCDNDVYAYGYLKGIKFDRTQTLGTGGKKCDFYLYKSKIEESRV